MLKEIADLLSKKGLSGWQIRESSQISHQSFLAQNDLECRRSVKSTKFEITLYKKRNTAQGDVLGMSLFRTSPVDRVTLEKSIDDAIYAANLVSNQPFELPEPASTYPDVEIFDGSLSQNTLIELEDRLRASVSKKEKIRLSSGEFFIDQIESRLINHKGLDVSQRETFLHTEYILLSRDGTKENEYIDRYSRRYLRDFHLEEQIDQSALFAQNATKSSLPKTGFFPVLLSGEPLDHLFNPLVARTSARLTYNKMLQNAVGKKVVSEGTVKGDTISLSSNPQLVGGLGSSRFDSYGTPLKKVSLIEKNITKNLLADHRYSQYLNIPVTGELGNIEVETGKNSFQKLNSPKEWQSEVIYHLEAFSAFEPNAITGAFSAEIRAGWEISSHGIKPIKGGSVSGVLQEALLDMYLSSESEQRERSIVPKGILFQKLAIAGN